MTKSQNGKYWRTWSRVRSALTDFGEYSEEDAAAERHQIHLEALGEPKSHTKFSNSDFDKVLDSFAKILAIFDGPSFETREETQPRRRMIHAIERLGLPDGYIQIIAHDQFNSLDWRTLPTSQLRLLSYTIAARARSRAAKD
jgi:hypothetical protein